MSGFPSRNELLSARLTRFTRVLHGVEAGKVEAVHHSRVASRRLREVLPILQLEGSVSAKLQRRLKKITRRLGPARETDVLLKLIDELRDSGRHSLHALTLVRDEVALARQQLSDEMASKDTDADLKRVARKLRHLSKRLRSTDDTPAQARAMRWAIEARIVRRADSLTSAIAAAGQVYLAERLHAVRI